MSMGEQASKLLGVNKSGEDAANAANRAGDLANDYAGALAAELEGSNQPEAAQALAMANKAVEEIMTGAVRLVEVLDTVAAMAAKL